MAPVGIKQADQFLADITDFDDNFPILIPTAAATSISFRSNITNDPRLENGTNQKLQKQRDERLSAIKQRELREVEEHIREIEQRIDQNYKSFLQRQPNRNKLPQSINPCKQSETFYATERALRPRLTRMPAMLVIHPDGIARETRTNEQANRQIYEANVKEDQGQRQIVEERELEGGHAIGEGVGTVWNRYLQRRPVSPPQHSRPVAPPIRTESPEYPEASESSSAVSESLSSHSSGVIRTPFTTIDPIVTITVIRECKQCTDNPELRASGKCDKCGGHINYVHTHGVGRDIGRGKYQRILRVGGAPSLEFVAEVIANHHKRVGRQWILEQHPISSTHRPSSRVDQHRVSGSSTAGRLDRRRISRPVTTNQQGIIGEKSDVLGEEAWRQAECKQKHSPNKLQRRRNRSHTNWLTLN